VNIINLVVNLVLWYMNVDGVKNSLLMIGE